MRDHIRNNVVAYVAVFLALGGGAYAATSHKVGAHQIKKNAVRSKQVKNHSLRTNDVKGLLGRYRKVNKLYAAYFSKGGVRDQLASLNGGLASMGSRVSTLEGQVADLEARTSALEQKSAQIDALQAQVAGLQSQLPSGLSGFNARIAALCAQAGQINGSYRSLESTVGAIPAIGDLSGASIGAFDTSSCSG